MSTLPSIAVTRRAVLRRVAVTALLGALAVGCVGGEEVQRQPEADDDGIQATGTIDGRRVAISRGAPVVTLGDCDPNDGLDRDLCMVFRTIDGEQMNLVVENPDALVAGETLDVRTRDCDACDDVTDVAVVDLRVEGDQRRAEGGRLVVHEAEERYAAEFDLRLPNGQRLTGSFNVRPGA